MFQAALTSREPQAIRDRRHRAEKVRQRLDRRFPITKPFYFLQAFVGRALLSATMKIYRSPLSRR